MFWEFRHPVVKKKTSAPAAKEKPLFQMSKLLKDKGELIRAISSN